jgi:hypothetical protein
MKTFDVTLASYDHDDIETHDQLMWVNAETYEKVVDFLHKNNILYQGIAEIRYVPTVEDGVDVILE